MRLQLLPLLAATLATSQLSEALSIPILDAPTSLEKRIDDHVEIAGQRCTLEHAIGGGGMGTVWKAHARSAKDSKGKSWTLAVKSSDDGSDMARGASILRRHLSGSPHLVTVYGTTSKRGTTYMAMEMMNGTTLQKQIDRGLYQGNDRAVQGHMYQILEGVAYMHSKGFAHTDLKPENVMLASSDPKDTWVKIVDPDLIISTHEAVSLCAPAAILSPEVMYNKKHIDPLANDVWETGFLLLMMMLKRTPWSGGDHQTSVSIWGQRTTGARAAQIKKVFPEVSTPLSELLARVFAPQETRISAAEFRDILANNRQTYPIWSRAYKSSSGHGSKGKHGHGHGHHKRDDEVSSNDEDKYAGYVCVPLSNNNGTASMF